MAKVRGGREAMRQRRFHARLRRLGVGLGAECFVARGSLVNRMAHFGRGTRVSGPGVFKGSEPIRLGNYCAVGEGVRMISSGHRTDLPNMNVRLHEAAGLYDHAHSRPIQIGNAVWVGDNVIVLPGVTIGDGAVIGAGSVVTRDIPPFAIAVGSPARVIRRRFDEDVIAHQLKLAWWEWPEERLLQSPSVLSDPLAPDAHH